MLGAAVTMILMLVLEWPNLGRWGRGERLAFWAFWTVVFAWALAIQGHLPVPTPTHLTSLLFHALSQHYLTPQPDTYW